jgi:hypothetical protein
VGEIHRSCKHWDIELDGKRFTLHLLKRGFLLKSQFGWIATLKVNAIGSIACYVLKRNATSIGVVDLRCCVPSSLTRLMTRAMDVSHRNRRTKQCTEVADRAFREGCLTGRNSVMVVDRARSQAFIACIRGEVCNLSATVGNCPQSRLANHTLV